MAGIVQVPYSAHQGALVAALDSEIAANNAAGRPCPDYGAHLADLKARALTASDFAALEPVTVEAAPFIDSVWTVHPVLSGMIWAVSVPHCAAAMASIQRSGDGLTISPTPAGIRRYPAFDGPAGLRMDGFRSLAAALDWLQGFLGAVDFVTYGEGDTVLEDTRGPGAPPVESATPGAFAAKAGL